MDRVHYAGHSILTGTEIAHALLNYAQALAEAAAAATMEVPTINGDGSRGRSELLIGPFSQIMSDAEHTEYEELVDEEVVRYLGDRARQVRSYGVSAPHAAISTSDRPRPWSDYDY